MLLQSNLVAQRATVESAEPAVVKTANLLGLNSDNASAWLRRRQFRVSERAATTQQQR